jgi:hypothetical protein
MPQLLGVAEALKNYVAGYPSLPVKPGMVSLDGLQPTGICLSVQINPGQIVKTFLDGTRVWRQPFTLFYRSPSTASDGDKSKMIGFLNDIGEWMKKNKPSDLCGQQVSEIAQVGLANVINHDKADICYSATYMFEYES